MRNNTYRSSILRSQATRTADWKQPYHACDDPDNLSVWWLDPTQFAEIQLRRTAEALPPLEPLSIEDEAYDYDPRYPMEVDHYWIDTFVLIATCVVILLTVMGISILFAMEIWRAPWDHMFGWLEDNRAAGIGILSTAALVVGAATLLIDNDD